MSRIRVAQPQPSGIRWPLALLAVLVICAGLYLMLPAKALEPFEIGTFGGEVEINKAGDGTWAKVSRGAYFEPGDRLRTGSESEVEFQIPDKVKLRLKPGSVLNFPEPRFYEKDPAYRLDLGQGVLYVITMQAFQQSRMIFSTPHAVAMSEGGYFRAEVEPETGKTQFGVLRGGLQVRKPSLFGGKKVIVREHEKAELPSEDAVAARPISRDEWSSLRETYELTQKSAAVEAIQLDLSKEAGKLFEFVFDHGTFYTPKFGYAGREFFREDSTNEVILETEYDVFPKGSFVGVYLKTRDFDISKFTHLEFEFRRVRQEGFPMNVRLELKDKSGVVRAFAAKLPKKQWTQQSFPLSVRSSKMINELTLVFAHDRVGEFKKGLLQFRNFNLVPRPEEEQQPEEVVTEKDSMSETARQTAAAVSAEPETVQAPEAKNMEPAEVQGARPGPSGEFKTMSLKELPARDSTGPEV